MALPVLLVFLAFGWLYLDEGGIIINLICNRVEPTQISCQLTTSGLLKSSVKNIPLNGLQGANIKTHTSPFGDGVINEYRVYLTTPSGETFLTASLGHDDWESKKIVDQINSFVNNPGEKQLKFRQDNRVGAYLLSSPFIAIGGIGLLVIIWFWTITGIRMFFRYLKHFDRYSCPK